MKPFDNRTFCTLLLVWSFSLPAANLPSDWQYDQSFTIATAGLTKLSLPLETLDAARPALEDLRLFDDAGNEVPFVIERPVPTVKIVRTVKSFQVTMQSRATVITIETGLTQPLDTITLETPALDFLKPVRIEASADGRIWQTLAPGQPVFRQPNGASRLQLTFASGIWAWLRLTVADEHSKPIPFTGARVHTTVTESAPVEWKAGLISERHENPSETRLSLNLGAANLDVASVQIVTDEPLFSRPVTLAVPQVSESAIREQPITQGTVFRIAVEGQAASENLSVPLEQRVRSRELLLLIKNENNPPLPIKSVRIERRPVYLVFLAKQAGAFHLLTGNEHCPAPKYDLAALGMNLKSVAVTGVKFSAADNPNYRAPEVLAGVSTGGAPLDVSAWNFRKPVRVTRNGAQQIELDSDILAQARLGFDDLRLVQDGKQIPYILEHTSISRALKPTVTTLTDAKEKNLSRWALKLPHAQLPITHFRCTAKTTLFEREFLLYEDLADSRGAAYRLNLGGARWIHKPDQAARGFEVALRRPLESDTFIVQTDNGDNPPVELENFEVTYPVTRVLFKAGAEAPVFLYYGNLRVAAPSYDLSLVADQLLAAEKFTAPLSAPEQLKGSAADLSRQPGAGGVVFWGILAVVVVVLLAIIARLLPKVAPPPS